MKNIILLFMIVGLALGATGCGPRSNPTTSTPGGTGNGGAPSGQPDGSTSQPCSTQLMKGLEDLGNSLEMARQSNSLPQWQDKCFTFVKTIPAEGCKSDGQLITAKDINDICQNPLKSKQQ